MQLIDILRNENFKDSNILAGHTNLNSEVKSVMILEATDIENWGAANQLILTSYYALINLNQEDLEAFLNKVVDLNISGIVLKQDRLIVDPPIELINFCQDKNLPLITIPKDVKYENIVLSVLQPLLDEQADVLNAYYDYRQLISQISLLDVDFNELIVLIKNFLHCEVVLNMDHSQDVYTTFETLPTYNIVSEKTIKNTKLMNQQYLKQLIRYPNLSTQSILVADVPNFENRNIKLLLFKHPGEITQREYMLIENILEFLTTKLIIQYSIKQDQFLHKNNQMLEILFSKVNTVSQRQEILEELNISHFPNYQGVLTSIYPNHNQVSAFELMPAIQFVRQKLRDLNPHHAYLQYNDGLLIVYNFNENQNLEKDQLSHIIDEFKKEYPTFHLHLAIREQFEQDFVQMNDSLQKLKQFMKIIYPSSAMLEYEKLGFFKLFLGVESKQELLSFVPDSIKELVKTKPELAKTLEVFLDTSQNFVRSGEILYVHPKTVRYRIEGLVDLLDLDLNNATQCLSYHVALKVLSYAELSI